MACGHLCHPSPSDTYPAAAGGGGFHTLPAPQPDGPEDESAVGVGAVQREEPPHSLSGS